jgi:TetR/AcrR family transcriptional repressor of bet genes
MGRPSNREERRAQIVDGLLLAMGEAGFQGATIQAIGRAAGLAPGLVHYHFDNKLEILLELLARLAARVDERFEARADDEAEPLARLDALIDAHLALGDDADERAVAAWVAVGTEALREPAVQKAYEELVERQMARFEGLVTEALDASGRATKGARVIAAGAMSAVEGAYRLAAAAPGVMPAGYAASAVKAMVRGAIAGEPAAR